MPATLDQILAATRIRVAAAKQRTPLAELVRQAAEHTPRGFERALRAVAGTDGIAVIAELKKASPSRGLIRGSFHPAALAHELALGGAAALSVLTDEEFFQGSLDYLLEVNAAVNVPLLRKDFIVDEYQLVEARAFCADAVLLIVAALNDTELDSLYRRATDLGLDVLCEVHDEHELEVAKNLGCTVIGVNSRNLRTFAVDLNVAHRLAPHIPPTAFRVAESGIASEADIASLVNAGYTGFLIGETLMKQDHPGEALLALLAGKKARPA